MVSKEINYDRSDVQDKFCTATNFMQTFCEWFGFAVQLYLVNLPSPFS